MARNMKMCAEKSNTKLKSHCSSREEREKNEPTNELKVVMSFTFCA